MAKFEVRQSDIHECLQLSGERWNSIKETACILDSHLEDIMDGFPLELNIKRFAIVAKALAGIAGYIDVWKEMHLDFDQAIALAGLAPPAFDVE